MFLIYRLFLCTSLVRDYDYSTSKLKFAFFAATISHALTNANFALLSTFNSLPDFSGNRYCINLVCVAGKPVESETK